MPAPFSTPNEHQNLRNFLESEIHPEGLIKLATPSSIHSTFCLHRIQIKVAGSLCLSRCLKRTQSKMTNQILTVAKRNSQSWEKCKFSSKFASQRN